jgi:G3E family GTPase
MFLPLVAFADVVLVNKIDLVDQTGLAMVERLIRKINPYATIHRTERCGIDLTKVLGRDAFNLDRILEVEPDSSPRSTITSTTTRSPVFAWSPINR